MTHTVKNFKIKLFADGADLNSMLEMNSAPFISGLTTNPTLMRKAGITDFKEFAKEVLSEIKVKPVSFEVFSDELVEMQRQAFEIANWGENVYVKIPITNSIGIPTSPVIDALVREGVKVNVTAVMTTNQVQTVAQVLNPEVPSYVSVFAGRIADTGRNPIPIMKQSLKLLSDVKACELIWASPREFLNIFQAEDIGCHVITATNEILKKIELFEKSLEEYSLETVQMFRRDAIASGYQI